MMLVRGLERVPPGAQRRVVTLGNFDGVHVGHQTICRRAVEIARLHGAQSLAITFYPHPARVLGSGAAPALITSLRDRLRLLGDTGLDMVAVQRFTSRFAQIEAEEFVREWLVRRLGAIYVVVGHSVRFGRGRRGDGVLLRECAESHGFGVEVVGPVSVKGTAVSSTAVREAILRGELRLAAALLGREHFVTGRVVQGNRRGVRLGFPTANLRVRAGVLPPDGVYAARVWCGDRCFGAVANLGFNPTFGSSERSLEAHLFDFSGDLYGQRLRLAFVAWLRAERRFASAESLAEQIARDIEAARRALDAA